MQHSLQTLAYAVIHLIYPAICLTCARSLSKHECLLCIPCTLSLPFTNFHLLASNPLDKKFWGRVTTQSTYSLLFMEKLSKSERLIYGLKYQNREDVGEFLAEETAKKYRNIWKESGINAILCIPLHEKRLKQRGYNQCHQFCISLSQSMGIPFYPKALSRISFQSSQTQMNRSSRWENVRQAFRINNSSLLEVKEILLVDDVLTTGATLEACASSIIKSCRANVHIFTMACKI